METTPRDLTEWRQFDRFSKLVLRHEAIDYLREQKCRRDRETVFSAMPQSELDKLCTVDQYPSDSYIFSAHGCDLPISNELVADAFAGLSATEQSILILRCVLDLTNEEIGGLVGMSRSAVQRCSIGQRIHSVRAEPDGGCAMTLFPYGEKPSEPHRVGEQGRHLAGNDTRTGQILPYSHSPSVQSVASNG